METIEVNEYRKSQLRDLTKRQQFLMATMLAALAATAYGIYVAVAKYGLIQDAIAGDASYAHKFDEFDRFSFLSIAVMLVGIANVIAVCMFVYSLAYNVFMYYNGAVNFTPGMTVGWFFIPMAHVFMPFKNMREISKSSNAMVTGGDAHSVASAPAHKSIVIWGLLWSIQMATMYVSIAYMMSSFGELKSMAPDEQQIFTFQKTFYFQLIGSGLSILNGIALLIFSSKIAKEHDAYRNS